MSGKKKRLFNSTGASSSATGAEVGLAMKNRKTNEGTKAKYRRALATMAEFLENTAIAWIPIVIYEVNTVANYSCGYRLQCVVCYENSNTYTSE